MPVVNAVQTSGVHSAIERASAATGIDFDYLLAQARLESGLDPTARARTSSASGLYQFIDQTWLDTMDRHGSAHGLGWADAAITSTDGRATVGDASMRSQILALRHDPEVAALMAAELARDNAGTLRTTLGREPDATELYLAHFLGAGGASEFLSALHADPAQSAVALFPKPAAANRPIFFEGGRPRSLGEVMEVMRGKVAGAMERDGAAFPGMPVPFHNARYDRSFSPVPTSEAPGATRPSMADTLRATFGAAEGEPLPAAAAQRVDAAYARFRSFGL